MAIFFFLSIAIPVFPGDITPGEYITENGWGTLVIPEK